MTPEQVHAEKIRERAASVFVALSRAENDERYVRQVVERHGQEQAFQEYMLAMGLSERLKKYVERPTVYKK